MGRMLGLLDAPQDDVFIMVQVLPGRSELVA